MKSIIHHFYYESMRDLEKIQKSKLRIAERVALEKAIVRLEDLKRLLDSCSIQVQY